MGLKDSEAHKLKDRQKYVSQAEGAFEITKMCLTNVNEMIKHKVPRSIIKRCVDCMIERIERKHMMIIGAGNALGREINGMTKNIRKKKEDIH